MYSIRTYIIVPRTVDRSYSLTGTRLGVSRAYCIDTGGGCGGQRADRGLVAMAALTVSHVPQPSSTDRRVSS